MIRLPGIQKLLGRGVVMVEAAASIELPLSSSFFCCTGDWIELRALENLMNTPSH